MIINNNLSYNCSDDITNELLRKENEKTKKNTIFIAINFGLDVFNLILDLIYYNYNKCLHNKNKNIIEQNRIEIEIEIEEKKFMLEKLL